MDPFGPDSGLDSDKLDSPPVKKREPGLTPAGSLMSIHVRRRTPPKDRLIGSPPAVRHSMPTEPKLAPDTPSPQPSMPAPTPVATMPVEPEGPPAPAPTPDPAPETAPAPPVAEAIRPAGPPAPESAPGPAPVTAAPAEPRADSSRRGADEAAMRMPPTPPMGEPGRRLPTVGARPMTASAPPAPIAAAPPRSRPAPPPSPLESPAIARHARTGAGAAGAQSMAAVDVPPSGSRQAVPPAAKREGSVSAPAPHRSEAPAPRPEPVRPEGIVSYWLRLRGNRRYPSKADLDQHRIATDWPNSILMRCRSGSKALEPEKVFSGPRGAPVAPTGADSPAVMELSPMMLQWLLTLAGDAAQERRPTQDIEAFPSRNESIRYGAFALPFSDDQTRIDHVLCHVYRAS